MQRFVSYGWHVEEVENGNDLNAIDVALQHAHADELRPSLICVQTHIGYGSPHKQDTCEAHGSPLGREEVQLTRQRLGWPFTEPFYIPEEIVSYLGTGSEVTLCLEAHKQLLTKGIRTRVVSMPSWELFDAQSSEYQQAILGAPEVPRLVVEAGIAQGWHRYTGKHGAMISVEQFGASAPASEVMRHYGFTVENVVVHALLLVQPYCEAGAQASDSKN